MSLVFISHANTDRKVGDAACAALEAAGIRCWIAHRDISPGTEYAEAIIDALEECRVMVLIFSSSANQSPQVHREVERAASNRAAIVPLRIEQITPTGGMAYFLSSVHWLDAFDSSPDARFPDLVRAVQARLDAAHQTAEVRQPPVALAAKPPLPSQEPVAAPREILGAASSAGAIALDPPTPNPLPALQNAWARAAIPTRLVPLLAQIEAFLERKSAWYWARAILVLIASSFAATWLEEVPEITQFRDSFYQVISDWGPRLLEPRYTKLVWIEDREYWYGEPQGRTPINRAYLAKIVTKLAETDAAVIALDFRVSLPHPDPNPTLNDVPYRNEVDKLIAAIVLAAKEHKIVLSRSITRSVTKAGPTYAVHPDIYQPYGICTEFGGPYKIERPIDPAALKNISCGYIAFVSDKRVLPSELQIGREGLLPSFSLAIAKAYDPERSSSFGKEASYATYMPSAEPRSVVSAASLLAADRHSPLLQSLGNKAVLVGGHWQEGQYGSGRYTDMHQAPPGLMSGTFVHENFVEAYLDGRYYEPIPAWLLRTIELVFCLGAILVFSYYTGIAPKVAIFLGLTALFVLIQWFMLNAIGSFLNAFVPIAALWLHSLFEKLLD